MEGLRNIDKSISKSENLKGNMQKIKEKEVSKMLSEFDKNFYELNLHQYTRLCIQDKLWKGEYDKHFEELALAEEEKLLKDSIKLINELFPEQ